MASSSTDIANLALAHLGEQRIESMDEDTAAARACHLVYPSTLDAALRSHRWNWAQDRVVLSELADEPSFGWAHQFELPADCLRIVEINDTEIGDVISEDYVIEGHRILTDDTAINLVYVKRVTNVAQYDALFVEMLALKLAVKLTEVIRGTTGKTAELMQMLERVTAPLARRVDANEGRRRKGLLPLNSHAIRARGVGTAIPFGEYP